MKLLLVTMYFPPAGGGGVQRPLKFATHLPAHGIEKNGRRGDMYVEAHVTLPERLSAEEQDAVKSFAEKAGLKY